MNGDAVYLAAVVGFFLGGVTTLLTMVRRHDRKVDRDIEARRAALEDERIRRVFEKHQLTERRGRAAIDRAVRDAEWGMARTIVDTTIVDEPAPPD